MFLGTCTYYNMITDIRKFDTTRCSYLGRFINFYKGLGNDIHGSDIMTCSDCVLQMQVGLEQNIMSKYII